MVWTAQPEVTAKQAFPNIGMAGVMIAGYGARNVDVTEQSAGWTTVTEQTASWTSA